MRILALMINCINLGIQLGLIMKNILDGKPKDIINTNKLTLIIMVVIILIQWGICYI